MIKNETNTIDELFRKELQDYTVPVVVSAMPIIAVAIKKGLFYKLAAFVKINTFTLVVGTATITSVATITTVKIVEHYQKIHAITHHTKSKSQFQTIETKTNDLTNSIEATKLDDQKSENVKAEGQKIEASTAKTTIITSNTSLQVNNRFAKTPQTMVTKKNTSDVVHSTTTMPMNVNQSTTQLNTTDIVTSETKTSNQKTTDTVKNSVAHKVVYVKAKPVVIEDTVVKVIRKMRPKKE